MKLTPKARRTLTGYLFISPWLFSLIVFTAYPVLASFYYSFTDYNLLSSPRWTGLDNYESLLYEDPLFWKSVTNTIFYAFISVPLVLLVALGLAIALNQNRRGIGIYRTIYYLPALMPIVATTLVWIVLFEPRLGLINQSLDVIGLEKVGWFRSATWAKPALIIIAVWNGAGQPMLILLAALKDVPRSLLEAAMLDGASRWQRFRYVVVPLITPALFFNLIIGMITATQVFASAFVAVNVLNPGGQQPGGPLNSMLLYAIHLYRTAFRYFDMGQASAMAIVLFLFLLVITLILIRSSSLWVFYQADEGR